MSRLFPRCSQRDPELRPSVEELLSLEYVRHHLQRYSTFLRQSMFARAESLLYAALPFAKTPSGDHGQSNRTLLTNDDFAAIGSIPEGKRH